MEPYLRRDTGNSRSRNVSVKTSLHDVLKETRANSLIITEWEKLRNDIKKCISCIHPQSKI